MKDEGLHRTAYRKWQKGGRKDLNDAEYAILVQHNFHAPGEPEAFIMSVNGPSPVDLLLEEAAKLEERKELKEAEDFYRSIIMNEPNSSKAYLHLALFLQFGCGKLDEAEPFYRNIQHVFICHLGEQSEPVVYFPEKPLSSIQDLSKHMRTWVSQNI